MKRNTDKKHLLFILLLAISNFLSFTIGNLNTTTDENAPSFERDGYVFIKIQARLLTTYSWLKEVHIQTDRNQIYALLIEQAEDQLVIYTHERNIQKLSQDKIYKVIPYSLIKPKIKVSKSYEILIP